MVFQEGDLAKESTWQAVVLIPKGEGDYRGIGLVEVMWKVVAVILNGRFTSSITFHDIQKTIPQLTDRLIEIIKMFNNVPVPDNPNMTMTQRKQQPVVGTLTLKVRQLNREREKKLEAFNMGCQKEWERRGVSREKQPQGKTCRLWGNRSLTKAGSRRG